MPHSTESLFDQLAQNPAILVTVVQTQGSAPREPGAWMAVFSDLIINTVGGGHLEFDAIAKARRLLQNPGQRTEELQRYALGPSLGQCCGGVVFLRFEPVSKVDIPALKQRLAAHHAPLTLFGGGHVGHALIRLLGNLPFEVSWIDSRDEVFPLTLPTNVHCEHSDPVASAVQQLVPGSRVLIMSFSHAEDLEILAACLLRAKQLNDLPWIGLIGSKTKWATFKHRLQERGYTDEDFARVTCPIGVAGITGKQPEVIAVSVAAQLLQLGATSTR